MLIKRNKFIFNCIYVLIFVLLLFLIFVNFSWKLAAISSVCLLVTSIMFLKFGFEISVISYSTLFLVCLWIFYCGQIMNYAFKLDGTNYLYFVNYGSENSSYCAYIFYFISQFLLTEFVGKSYTKNRNIKNDKFKEIPRNLPLILFTIGIIPRLYYDFSYLRYGLINGYHGTALYIPQFVNTLAFFADIAILIELVRMGRRKRATVLLMVTLLYKCFMMVSGSRAESFCFIIILVYIYIFINKDIKISKLVIYFFIGYIALAFIMTIGDLRSVAFQSVSVFWESFLLNMKAGFLSDMFGEFGSAFTTLVKTINDTPGKIDYGYGLSYVSGMVSIIPTLVNKIPILSDTVVYITQYSNVSTFGGAFLGEAYYNFGWFGLVVIPIVGKIVGWITGSLENLKTNKIISKNTVLSLMFAVSMLPYIRGYFSDMSQKIIWLTVIMYFVVRCVRGRKGIYFEKV